jgi:hypothetical protein
MERLHQLDGRADDLRQLTRPDPLIETLQIGLIVGRQHASAAVIHDAEWLVCPEYLRRERSLADHGKTLSKPEDVAVNRRFDLFLSSGDSLAAADAA